MEEVTDKERADVQIAMLYDLRLRVKKSDKETFTKNEIFELLDTIAQEKTQQI